MLKFFPVFGAFLLSVAPAVAPVQAFETFEELDKACNATEENIKLCGGVSEWISSVYITGTLCELDERGVVSTEQLTKFWEGYKGWDEGALWKKGAQSVFEEYPNCPIKP